MTDLFDAAADDQRAHLAPLAARMRPRTLSEVAGQPHLVGPDGRLIKLLASGVVPNLVLVGPPGTGKTTIARLVAADSDMALEELSAVAAGLADVRRVVDQARQRLGGSARQTVLFLDEVHRFNKTQQDALLPSVEDGTIRLVGATTENPYVTINRALLSRVLVLELRPLDDAALREVLTSAAADTERGLSRRTTKTVTDAALDTILARSGGDARRALTLLEAAWMVSGESTTVDEAEVEAASDARAIRFDRAGDEHYDRISAYIKSMRAGDAEGALHWLATLLVGGEDPLFIARRLVIFAAEDIGNAKPNALLLAQAALDSVQSVGMPECRIALAQVTRYCAESAKSRQAIDDIDGAMEQIRRMGSGDVPIELTNRKGHGHSGE